MKITIDTEKDSEEDIKSAIQLLEKIIGETPMPPAPEPAEPRETEEAKPATIQEQPSGKEQEEAEQLLNQIMRGKIKKGDNGKNREDSLPGIPKSVKEAYELAENLETY
ncbi:hypothetical protein HYY72_04520 [Candidatus Woesearchaeota archaeon]|nr:hypothetical protein [Candidatus Woesearchaeota archaeon]